MPNQGTSKELDALTADLEKLTKQLNTICTAAGEYAAHIAPGCAELLDLHCIESYNLSGNAN
jgi:hypothetical protein